MIALLLCLVLLISVSSCTSSNYDESVQADLAVKKTQLIRGDLFCYNRLPLTDEERSLLDFLYAYMPEGDITDYSAEFYLKNVQTALRARSEMPWGETVPDKVFRHFVVPVRVNNELLDSSRWVFYEELKPRVKDLSMEEAILEINHWCHEKATYQPSDSRTSSPLATVKTALGRCGEESTFAVAAMRAMGIPARQVYTPRWAHTDDNHAWVEVWANGTWHFLGACEPEPVLDLAWFNAPASRGMLMHTCVFGRYRDVEEIMSQTANYTEINVIDNYAQTARGTVRVVDADGNSVKGARVEFKIYNYAEFYTASIKWSDEEGKAFLTAGLGDMLVFASKEDKFGFAKYSFCKEGEVKEIALTHHVGEVMSLPLDIVPPSEGANVPEVTPEQRERNSFRFAYEDSLRKAYESTFMTLEQASRFATENGYNAQTLAPLLVASRGNHAVLCAFLQNVAPEQKETALYLLQVISQKDLRDINTVNLNDHLNFSMANGWDNDSFKKYILNPRIGNEELTPYKSFFRSEVCEEDANAFRENPLNLVKWCTDSIALNASINAQNIIISPAGVWRARVADKRSRNQFFVAVARSLGIPAWRDAVDGKIYYLNRKDAKPMEADFETVTVIEPEKGTLRATYSPTSVHEDPAYYSHYSISKYEEGTFKLLNYGEDGSSNWSRLLKNGTSMAAGYYVMVTGTRLASGAVLSQLSFFTVDKNKQTVVPLVMRESTDSLMVIGSFNSESLFLPKGNDEQKSVLSAVGRGYFVVGLLGTGEPTDHALRDISACKEDLEKWGRGILLLFSNKKQLEQFNPDDYPNLPKNVIFGVDEGEKIRHSIANEFKLKRGGSLPVLVIGDTFNRVVFFSQGYTIGLGEQLMKAIKGL